MIELKLLFDMNMNEKKFNKKKNMIVKNNMFFLKQVFKYAPEMVCWKMVLMIFSVFINSYYSINFMEYLVNSINYGIKITIIFRYITIYTVVLLSKALLQDIFDYYVNFNSKKKLHKQMHNLIFKKVEIIDMKDVENPEFYNNFIWSLNEIDNRTIISFEIIINFIECILSLIVAGSMLISYDKLLIVFSVIPILVNWLVQNYTMNIHYKYSQLSNVIEREKEYTKRIFYLQQYAKELRLYQLGEIFIEKFNSLIAKSIQIYYKFVPKFIIGTMISLLTDLACGTYLIALYLVYCAVVKKSMELGSVVAAFTAMGVFSGYLSKISNLVNKTRNNALYAEKIMMIINYKPQIEGYIGQKIDKNDNFNIEVKNVSFKYPNSNGYILENINMTIQKGQKIAIVGLNGSGKSTFVKLLLRLYDSTKGAIYYNNNNICNLTTNEYRNKFSVIFQDYQLYSISLRENLMLDREFSDELIKHYLEMCLLDKYKEMLDNQVTKEFMENGLVFSGGENQKIAIARALLADKDVIIMDEPSSSLDPYATDYIMGRIFEIYREKTIIIVSHKLSIAKQTDKIFYFENGRVVEEGSHDELLDKNGKYAELYEIQASQFS